MAVLSLLFFVGGCDKQIELHRSLLESEANEMIAELADNGVKAEKLVTKDGVTLMVNSPDMAKSVHVLQAAGLPRQNQVSFGEVFKKEGVISTPTEERARYLYALSQELEHTLNQIDGIVKARVHVVLPERIAPGEPVLPSSAAVFIKHQVWLDPDIILPRIERMIAKSIPGLSGQADEKLAVIFVAAKEYKANEHPVVDTSDFSSPYLFIFWLILGLILGGLGYRLLVRFNIKVAQNRQANHNNQSQ